MTVEEDKERGNLTVTINYIEIGQAIKTLRYVLDKLEAKLNVAAANRDLEIIEKKDLSHV